MARATAPTQFVTVRSEGGLLPSDLLARIAASDPHLGGLLPVDYGLEKGDRLSEAASRAWTRCKTHWASFTASLEILGEGERGVSETREQWMLPLFRELGYGRLTYRAAAEAVADRTFAISHRVGAVPDAPPVHIVAVSQDLDQGEGRRTTVGGLRVSPHGLVQDYLNRTEHLWGIVTNGKRLRLLRDNASLTRPAYVEFDLEAMMEGGVYADFVLLYLVLHRTRLPRGQADAATCWLERWRQAAVQGGTRALDSLRDGVQAALIALGRGFLAHPAHENDALRERLTSGALSVEDYYRQLLRLVYRLLFLFVAEERDLLFAPEARPRARDIYAQYYSLSRRREVAERRRRPDAHDDVWRALSITFSLMRDGSAALDLAALSGGLFDERSCPDLDGGLVTNGDLLEALRGVSLVRVGAVTRRVNYRDLGVEELGSVYESLLDLHPRLVTAGERSSFELAAGSERKTTGSYYTPPPLVAELIKSALEPVIAQALAVGRTVAEKRVALLRLRVCDAACGSGHFALAAARRIGREIARLDAGEAEPDLATLRNGMREAIRHCIYGVDLNPLAVDLCKLALWIEGHTPGRPLSFLDHRIKCGNSLVGATPQAVDGGIPDEAFTPLSGDDKIVAMALKKRNRVERSGQDRLFSLDAPLLSIVASEDEVLDALDIGDMSDDDAGAVRAKEERYRTFTSSSLGQKRLLADTWTATFFWSLVPDAPAPPLEADLRAVRRGAAALSSRQHEYVKALTTQYRFFHWALEFPEVFADDQGFDCVLGNPPWERFKLNEKEYFAVHDPDIVAAPNVAARQRLIATLVDRNPRLAERFAGDQRAEEAQSKFVRTSSRFPLTAVGEVNTYALFAEHCRSLLARSGSAGIICPTGIATDNSTRRFFGDLSKTGALASLFDFENSDAIFPEVHRSYKFCLLTMTGALTPHSEFAFFCTSTWHLQEPLRRFHLSPADIELLNPNTRTCPIFRTWADASLTKAIYHRVAVWVNDGTADNPWGVSFQQMINMGHDSDLFQPAPGPGLVPLYEAKMLHQYDHRWATYDSGEIRDLAPAEKADPEFVVTPRYWVPQREVKTRLAGRWNRRWLLGFRDIARNTDERTAIISVLPRVGVGHKAPLIMPSEQEPHLEACLLANANALLLDYVARQKVGGTSLSFFILKQLPILVPQAYAPVDIAYIVPRVVELAYTAWDMRPFAQDMGYDGPPFPWDEERRAVLRAELDAYFARLYGLSRKQLRYILDPHDLTDHELADILDPAEDPLDVPRTHDFPGETFRVLKEREVRQYGEYRTRRLVLQAWDRLHAEPEQTTATVIHARERQASTEPGGVIMDNNVRMSAMVKAQEQLIASYAQLFGTDIEAAKARVRSEAEQVNHHVLGAWDVAEDTTISKDRDITYRATCARCGGRAEATIWTRNGVARAVSMDGDTLEFECGELAAGVAELRKAGIETFDE